MLCQPFNDYSYFYGLCLKSRAGLIVIIKKYNNDNSLLIIKNTL